MKKDSTTIVKLNNQQYDIQEQVLSYCNSNYKELQFLYGKEYLSNTLTKGAIDYITENNIYANSTAYDTAIAKYINTTHTLSLHSYIESYLDLSPTYSHLREENNFFYEDIINTCVEQLTNIELFTDYNFKYYESLGRAEENPRFYELLSLFFMFKFSLDSPSIKRKKDFYTLVDVVESNQIDPESLLFPKMEKVK
jgi:hypothetical protein